MTMTLLLHASTGEQTVSRIFHLTCRNCDCRNCEKQGHFSGGKLEKPTLVRLSIPALDQTRLIVMTIVPLSIQFWTSSAEITINCIPSVHSLSPISQHFSLTTVGPSTTNSSPTSTIFNSRSMSLTRQCETCD
ncbi:uncharacterized protein FFNC_11601 [Fusarium fujikuroi]|nr:uncharacterized protein FFNC_11601 [Fusarium fujikuroi]